jgi:antitoxin VapB
MTELDEKTERLARLAHASHADGVLLSLQPNFAWLSGGQSNRIDGSTDAGAGSLLVTVSGKRFIVANTIEMPRLRDEALHGLGFGSIEYPWTRDHDDPAAVPRAVRDAGAASRIAADAPLADCVDVSAAIVQAQVPLTDAEVTRYRALAADVASAVESLCRTLEPGESEGGIACRVNQAAALAGARAIVTLVGADDRIARFRHPVPTSAPWLRTLLVGICAERNGLVVALSRIVSAGPPSDTLRGRTSATAAVFGALLSATYANATGADLFKIAADAYTAAGHPGEEARHHQGGAIGYRSRDWIAHPGSRQIVQRRQAFAWNPSITGTKVEDTALLIEDGLDLITATRDWPRIELRAGSRTISAPAILER